MEPLELAMFPLESALLPDQDLPLRIFEPRYGALVRHCLDTGDPFGVVLISRGREVGGGDSRCDVGVMSRIIECDDQGAGRYALHCRTGERIRVHEWLPDDPYPRARVAPWPDEPGDEVSAAQLVDVEDRAVALFERIAQAGGITLPGREVLLGLSHPDRYGRPLHSAGGADGRRAHRGAARGRGCGRRGGRVSAVRIAPRDRSLR